MEFLTTIQQNREAAFLVAVVGLLALFISFRGITNIVRAFKSNKPKKVKPGLTIDIKKNDAEKN